MAEGGQVLVRLVAQAKTVLPIARFLIRATPGQRRTGAALSRMLHDSASGTFRVFPVVGVWVGNRPRRRVNSSIVVGRTELNYGSRMSVDPV